MKFKIFNFGIYIKLTLCFAAQDVIHKILKNHKSVYNSINKVDILKVTDFDFIVNQKDTNNEIISHLNKNATHFFNIAGPIRIIKQFGRNILEQYINKDKNDICINIIKNSILNSKISDNNFNIKLFKYYMMLAEYVVLKKLDYTDMELYEDICDYANLLKILNKIKIDEIYCDQEKVNEYFSNLQGKKYIRKYALHNIKYSVLRNSKTLPFLLKCNFAFGKTPEILKAHDLTQDGKNFVNKFRESRLLCAKLNYIKNHGTFYDFDEYKKHIYLKFCACKCAFFDNNNYFINKNKKNEIPVLKLNIFSRSKDEILRRMNEQINKNTKIGFTNLEKINEDQILEMMSKNNFVPNLEVDKICDEQECLSTVYIDKENQINYIDNYNKQLKNELPLIKKEENVNISPKSQNMINNENTISSESLIIIEDAQIIDIISEDQKYRKTYPNSIKENLNFESSSDEEMNLADKSNKIIVTQDKNDRNESIRVSSVNDNLIFHLTDIDNLTYKDLIVDKLENKKSGTPIEISMKSDSIIEKTNFVDDPYDNFEEELTSIFRNDKSEEKNVRKSRSIHSNLEIPILPDNSNEIEKYKFEEDENETLINSNEDFDKIFYKLYDIGSKFEQNIKEDTKFYKIYFESEKFNEDSDKISQIDVNGTAEINKKDIHFKNEEFVDANKKSKLEKKDLETDSQSVKKKITLKNSNKELLSNSNSFTPIEKNLAISERETIIFEDKIIINLNCNFNKLNDNQNVNSKNDYKSNLESHSQLDLIDFSEDDESTADIKDVISPTYSKRSISEVSSINSLSDYAENDHFEYPENSYYPTPDSSPCSSPDTSKFSDKQIDNKTRIFRDDDERNVLLQSYNNNLLFTTKKEYYTSNSSIDDKNDESEDSDKIFDNESRKQTKKKKIGIISYDFSSISSDEFLEATSSIPAKLEIDIKNPKEEVEEVLKPKGSENSGNSDEGFIGSGSLISSNSSDDKFKPTESENSDPQSVNDTKINSLDKSNNQMIEKIFIKHLQYPPESLLEFLKTSKNNLLVDSSRDSFLSSDENKSEFDINKPNFEVNESKFQIDEPNFRVEESNSKINPKNTLYNSDELNDIQNFKKNSIENSNHTNLSGFNIHRNIYNSEVKSVLDNVRRTILNAKQLLNKVEKKGDTNSGNTPPSTINKTNQENCDIEIDKENICVETPKLFKSDDHVIIEINELEYLENKLDSYSEGSVKSFDNTDREVLYEYINKQVPNPNKDTGSALVEQKEAFLITNEFKKDENKLEDSLEEDNKTTKLSLDNLQDNEDKLEDSLEEDNKTIKLSLDNLQDNEDNFDELLNNEQDTKIELLNLEPKKKKVKFSDDNVIICFNEKYIEDKDNDCGNFINNNFDCDNSKRLMWYVGDDLIKIEKSKQDFTKEIPKINYRKEIKKWHKPKIIVQTPYKKRNSSPLFSKSKISSNKISDEKKEIFRKETLIYKDNISEIKNHFVGEISSSTDMQLPKKKLKFSKPENIKYDYKVCHICLNGFAISKNFVHKGCKYYYDQKKMKETNEK